jgi:oxalate decarboxylase/phosphoglucose isomerase-like protein (cupin superfamily)
MYLEPYVMMCMKLSVYEIVSLSVDTHTHIPSGDCIYVPTGWSHSVRNVKVNVKIAFDMYEATHYHLYAQTAALASQYFMQGNITDYMRVAEVMRNAL